MISQASRVDRLTLPPPVHAMTPLTSLCLSLLVLLASAEGARLGQDLEQLSEGKLRQEFRTSFETGKVTNTLQKIALHLELDQVLQGSASWDSMSRSRVNLLCLTCNAGVAQIINGVESGANPDDIAGNMVNLCVQLGIANLVLCENFIKEAEPQLFWILKNKHVTGKDVCGVMFVGFGCDTDNPERMWEVQLPDTPKPPIAEIQLPEPGSPVMKVLHLADTHFDPYYLPGSNAVCGEKYFCCRKESGDVMAPEDAAGKWGDYRYCDAPEWLLHAIFQHISETHKDIDFIVWTGDLIPHIIWNTTREGNLDVIRRTVQMVHDYFPDTPVFPAIGNHESHPLNAFPQPYIDNEFDISWLYDEITTLWSTWLPEDVASSVAYSAFYSTPIKPGLRILSVNSNYCYGFNWWLVYDDVDPAQELQWMVSELQRAEDEGEKVYIMSHIPPGHRDCGKTWSHQYNRIVHRYESTIAGLFYGHTHKDHFMVFYDPDVAERAYHVGYVAQSQTPYHLLNPGYKIYTIDGDYEGSTYRVLDHENWVLDLDYANEHDDPLMTHLYSAKEAYGLPDLTPASWSNLLHEMSLPNSTAFDAYYRNYIKAARPYLEKGCNEACKATVLCRTAVSDNSDRSHCDHL